MKLLKSKKALNYFIRFLATAIVVIIISCSIKIDKVVQPAFIVAGENLHVELTVQVHSDVSRTARLMVAFLAPKAWNARAHATLNFTSTKTTGVQQMTLIPVGEPAANAGGLDWASALTNKVGNGGNLINDWEWVAYFSNISYAMGDNDDAEVYVNIDIPTTPDNISFKMAYAVANSSDGLGSDPQYYGSFKGNCLEVQGPGDLIDFCNPQLSTVEPRIALDNDIITLGFDAGVTDNLLQNASDVYLCATGITEAGERIEVCTPAPSSKTTSLGARRFRIDLWPRQYFSLTETQKLKSLEYFFTNADGTVKVGYGGLQDPFLFTFSCK